MRLIKKLRIKSFEWKSAIMNKVDPPSYKFIAADITSNCNLRCPFCINDFSNIRGNRWMEEETFEKLLKLLPLASVANFGISCLFEPCLHPRFVDFMEKIPSKYFARVFFTTNLSMPFTDEALERLSRCHFHHVNISIDTLNPGLYETLRKGAKYERFMDNLKRITAIFQKNPDAPKIRFSTVVLQPNFDELPKLLEICAKEYSASVHEFRYVYQVHHVSSDWKRDYLVSNDQWDQLQEYLARCGLIYECVPPPPGYYTEDGMPYSRPNLTSETTSTPPAEKLPLGLRVAADGTISLYGKDEISFNLNEIPEPYPFFNSRRVSFEKML